MTDVALDRKALELLATEAAMLNRKCYMLDRAELAHGVFVVVYAPEGTEHGDTLQTQTRVAVFSPKQDGATWSGIIEVQSRSIKEILNTHGYADA